MIQNLVKNNQKIYKWRANLNIFETHMADNLGFRRISIKQAYKAKTLFLVESEFDYITTPHHSEIKRLLPN